MNNIKVLKFGGTSLRNSSDRIKVIEILKKEMKTNKLVVVVSAIGRYPEPYATDTLLSFSTHLNSKAKDEIMSCGEMISSHLLCNECLKQQLNCACLNFIENGIRTTDQYGNASIITVDSNDIYQSLKKVDILIIPGFFGTNKYHFVSSLGRGGSDLSAIVIADSLGLKEVTIYSDVAGIYSADPKQLDNPLLYLNVNIRQALRLSSLNVPVIQQKACLYAYQKKIKMILKSTFRLEGSTIVDENAPNHSFIISKQSGYYLLDKTDKLTEFDLNLTLNQAHQLFISQNE